MQTVCKAVVGDCWCSGGRDVLLHLRWHSRYTTFPVRTDADRRHGGVHQQHQRCGRDDGAIDDRVAAQVQQLRHLRAAAAGGLRQPPPCAGVPALVWQLLSWILRRSIQAT